ncbi:MAG: hypothetical protein JOZ18_09905 [Chloroflexi bacterium]|nr:hypothetical protein [Chloroflexota bacterium]
MSQWKLRPLQPPSEAASAHLTPVTSVSMDKNHPVILSVQGMAQVTGVHPFYQTPPHATSSTGW